MTTNTINHPLAVDLLTKLRDKSTTHEAYKNLSYNLSIILAIEASRDLATKDKAITTPLTGTTGAIIEQSIILVPILRAGLSMLSPIQSLFTNCYTGFIGLERVNTDNGPMPNRYYINIPYKENATVFILDPMVATGGSAHATIVQLKEQGLNQIKLLSFLAAPEGLSYLKHEHPDVNIYTVAIDDKLDENKYIVPGLGDFGDRLFGTQHT